MICGTTWLVRVAGWLRKMVVALDKGERVGGWVVQAWFKGEDTRKTRVIIYGV
jgi:hypothetical protein